MHKCMTSGHDRSDVLAFLVTPNCTTEATGRFAPEYLLIQLDGAVSMHGGGDMANGWLFEKYLLYLVFHHMYKQQHGR